MLRYVDSSVPPSEIPILLTPLNQNGTNHLIASGTDQNHSIHFLPNATRPLFPESYRSLKFNNMIVAEIEGTSERQDEPKPFVFLVSLIFVSAGIFRKIGKKKCRRLRINVEKDHEWAVNTSDILYSATPSNVNYGSFSSPWSGDLDKFDV